MRTRKAIDAVGGKGFDISVALRCLDQETIAVGFQAGMVGEELADLLVSYGIQLDLVDLPGETRIAHVIIEEALHQHSHITTQGYSVTPREQELLFELIKSHLPRSTWVASAGSLPSGLSEDFFQVLAHLAHESKVPILLDVSGPPARLVLSTRPDILKMNQQEFQKTFDASSESVENLTRSAEKIAKANRLPSLVLTLGSQGILAITPQGTFITRGPVLQEVKAAGAGDAVSAALMWRLSLGESWGEALRWAAAAGAATALTEATAECELQVVRELLPRVDQKAL